MDAENNLMHVTPENANKIKAKRWEIYERTPNLTQELPIKLPTPDAKDSRPNKIYCIFFCACTKGAKGIDLADQAYNNGDNNTAFQLYLNRAEDGEAYAQFMIGRLYDRGEGVSKDLQSAFTWYEKSALQNNVKSQFNVGYMYFYGEGIKKDYNKALEWFLKAAEQGLAQAQFYLGVNYDLCYGFNKDFEKAAYWYRKAAEQNIIPAQYNLAWMLSNGNGVKRDYK